MKKWLSCALIFCLLLSALPARAVTAGELLSDAASYLQDGDTVRALACCELVQRLEPDAPDGFLAEAAVRLALNELDAAAAALEQALRADPASETVWLMKCRLDIAKKDLAALNSDLIFAEVLHADLSPLYADMGELYYIMGNRQAALSCFTLAAGPLSPEQAAMYDRLQNSNLRLRSNALQRAYMDSVFAAEEISLVPAETPAITAQHFELSPEMLTALELDAAEIKNALAEGDVTWQSLSPAGNSGLFTLADRLCTYMDGVCHLAYPSPTRGVADEYGNLEKYIKRYRAPGYEGVVYSPDGRYAFIGNARQALTNGYGYFDPVLIDLFTGEFILAATYAQKIRDPRFGMVTTGCFTADGRYFYYVLYGAHLAGRASLCRCDLTSGITEYCAFEPEELQEEDGEPYFSYDSFLYDPRLSETADGDLLIIRDVLKRSKRQGLTRITPNGRDWHSYDSIYLPDKMALDEALANYGLRDSGTEWTLRDTPFAFPASLLYGSLLEYSPDSGRALLPVTVNNADAMLMCATIEEEISGLDRVWALDAENLTMVGFTAEELAAEYSARAAEQGDSLDYVSLQYALIAAARLSPDGNYALLLAAKNDAGGLYLLRLDDMAVRPVQGIDPETFSSAYASSRYMQLMEWNGDTLLIWDGNSSYSSYRFSIY